MTEKFDLIAPQQKPIVPFLQRIENALKESGINPEDWTDEELGGPEGNEGWRTISENHDIVQAARKEWRRRQGPADQNYSGAWLR